MERPRRAQRLRSAPSVQNTLSVTSSQPAPQDDVPQVLERSMRRLTDVKQRAEAIMGPGILVKLFAVPRGDIQSVDDPKPTLWIVGSPNTIKWTPRTPRDAHKASAIATNKASHGARVSASRLRVKAKVNRGKAGRKKEQGSLETGGRNVTEQQVQEDHSGSDDTNDEQELREDEEDEEDDAGEYDAGVDVVEDDIVEAPNDSEGEEDLEEGDSDEEGETVVVDEDEHDTEEQDNDRHDRTSEEDEPEAADKAENEEVAAEADLAEDVGEAGEQEAEGQQEAARESESEREKKTCGETGPHSGAKGNNGAAHDVEEEEYGGEKEVGKPQGDQEQMQGVENGVGQRGTTYDRHGPWRRWETGDMHGEEGEESSTNSDEGERTARDGKGGAGRDRRKRASGEDEAMDNAPLQEHPNKRSKTDREENEDDAAKNDSLSRTNGLETQTRPRTPSPKSTTPSSPKTIEVARQVSVVPGLEGTESAVWDAARRNDVFTSLSGADQKKMICTAVSLASEKGIKELQRFVCDTRRNVKQNGKSLRFETDLSVSQSDADTRNADGTLIPRDSGLARLTALYHQITTLDNAAIKLSVTRRMKLAAMAQYRKSLLQEGAGRKQAKAANLRLFRAIHPEHATIERPDEATKSVALDDWQRLRDRLREGKRWLDIRDLFGGAGAFLALPSQCVSDRYIQKMQVEKFESWLLLHDVAWRALDAHARLTLNELVQMSLAGQPLPEAFLALETLEAGTGTALDSLSGMLTGWFSSNRICGDASAKSIATPTQREGDSGAAAHDVNACTTSTTSRAEEAGQLGRVSQMEKVKSVEDGFLDGLDDIDFDESLSQE